MGSIPATLDIYIVRRNLSRHFRLLGIFSNNLHRSSTNSFYSFYTHSRIKRSRCIFFSYKSPLRARLNNSKWHVINWLISRPHRFSHLLNDIVIYKTWLILPVTTVSHLRVNIKWFTPSIILRYCSKNSDSKASIRNNYSLQQCTLHSRIRIHLKVYFDLISSVAWRFSSCRIRYTRLCHGSLIWRSTMHYREWIMLHSKLQELNLTNKKLFRQYFRFYTYWFEAFTFTSFLDFDVFTPSSKFLYDSIGFSNFTELQVKEDILRPQFAKCITSHFLLRVSLQQALANNDIVRFKFLNEHSLHINPYRCSLATPSTSFYVRKNDFNTSLRFPTSLKGLRRITWSQKQKTYFMRNRSWKNYLKVHRVYWTSSKLSRRLRRGQVYRKVRFKISRALSICISDSLSVRYRELSVDSSTSRLLNRNSLSGSYAITFMQSITRLQTLIQLFISNSNNLMYRLYQPQIFNSSSYFNAFVSYQSQSVHTLSRKTLMSQFMSWEFFVPLLKNASCVMWKYNFAILMSLYSLSSVFSRSATFVNRFSSLLMLILQTQAYSYEPYYMRLYAVYSNLSTLHLEEYYNTLESSKQINSQVLKYYSKGYLRPNGFLWYYTSLIQFLEFTIGRKVALNFGPFLETALTFADRSKCLVWGSRILGFQRILGPKIFIYEALEVLVVSIRLKDPAVLANWIRVMLARISFWKFRLIFRYLKFLLQNLIKSSFPHFNFKGAKFRLKGKISVAGNARTRMVFYQIGSTSHTTMKYRISYDLSYVHTFTGIQGFKIWFFY